MDYNDEALIRRIHREVADYYDEELELELEDRDPMLVQSVLAGETGGPGDNSNLNGDDAERAERHRYFRELFRLQGELVKLQSWVVATGHKVVILFEGRDAAGKGGVIKRITQRLNPRVCRVAALPAPNDRERTQWYFQRYVAHLPAAGEMVLFDRSWYNRAGVERVMGFAKPEQVKAFLKQAPVFEKLLVDDGIVLFKYWLCCDQDMQEERFAERLNDPLKRWKLSPIDLQARVHYDDYTRAREAMLEATHRKHAPWTLVDFNDQRQGRLTLIRDLLSRLPDTDVAPAKLDFPPLKGKPAKEKFGLLKPIGKTGGKKD